MSRSERGFTASTGSRASLPFEMREPKNINTLALLSPSDDDHVGSILNPFSTDVLTTRDIVGRLDVSRATAHRRRNRIQAASDIEASTTDDPNGIHRGQFEMIADCVTRSFSAKADQVRTDDVDRFKSDLVG